MGDKNRTAGTKTKELINLSVMLFMFAGYALTFMVPKFYGATDRYVGVFVFLCLCVLTINNIDILLLLKKKDRDLIILALLLAVTLINLLLVRSGLGAFFVAADFALIFFLSGHIYFSGKNVIIMTGAYMALLLYWFFIAYPKLFDDYAYYGYNTNTAATFTIYTLLCAFLLTVILAEREDREKGAEYYLKGSAGRLSGLFAVMLMVKGFQLALWHRARGAFIMLAVFMVLWFFIPKKWWRNRVFYYTLWILSTFGSLAFVAVYVMVGATGVNMKLPFFYKEVFSGRDKIWLEFFTLFSKKPLTGIGTNVTIESFFEFNVHNAMYNFLVIDGIIVFAGIIYLIFRFAKRGFDKTAGSPLRHCALVVLLSVFFESFFDVDLIWADYALNLLLLTSITGCNGEV
ncbi:MAG: hypothetical protein K5770_09490 [Lachnospiraceae bacterium]|nr:hypothetical protein [Lachnospiraceae bacterium]